VSAAAPAVSVVVPTRDRPELLAQTIASVAGQDYDGQVECVVVHDGGEPPLDGNTRAGGCTIRLCRGILRTQTLAHSVTEEGACDERRPSRTALVMQTQFARLITQQDNWPTCCFDRTVVAGHRQFAGKAGEGPATQVDMFHLRLKHGLRGVHMARQRACAQH